MADNEYAVCDRCGVSIDDDSFPCVTNAAEPVMAIRSCCDCLKIGDVVCDKDLCNDNA